ncbi:MAG TPA: hypothetical protein VFD05_01750 [Bacilli bacterium]|nr:hypothetical protein [Bacilli bacterium]
MEITIFSNGVKSDAALIEDDEYTEHGEGCIGTETFFLEFNNELPGRLFYEIDQTRDGLAQNMYFDVSFTFADEHPAYSGPYMPREQQQL